MRYLLHCFVCPIYVAKMTNELIPYPFKLFYIVGTAHCANMYPDSPSDPPQLKEARVKIEALIGEWLKQD